MKNGFESKGRVCYGTLCVIVRRVWREGIVCLAGSDGSACCGAAFII